VSPVPAAALLASLAVAALVSDSIWVVGAITLVLLVPCLQSPRRKVYLAGIGISAGMLFVLTPWIENIGSHPFWHGPIVPVIGELTVTREELASAALAALRLSAVGLAFAVYALRLDHDRLLRASGWARRSSLAVALGGAGWRSRECARTRGSSRPSSRGRSSEG
jgi:hypothetical protein